MASSRSSSTVLNLPKELRLMRDHRPHSPLPRGL
jgi:hypothetical protein